ncbi:MAG: HAD family hydrolase [Bacteroidales bacterium]|jgi:HAD superfamily hydrolase (TIGR01549 family)|nr:HAD family hydrolase [Bacteroidales bacterium]
MAIKSISDLYNYSLFIFDLDNTIYNEEEYLLQAYMTIASKFAGILPDYDKDGLYKILTDLYLKEGREKLFDKFLETVGLDNTHMTDCLNILRSFKPEKSLEIYNPVFEILQSIVSKKKSIFILTNGNVDQQKNKIRNIKWNGLEEHIRFVYADEIEPKPAPGGVFYILRITGTDKQETIFIGDRKSDRTCAENGGVTYIDIKKLTELFQHA